MGVGNMKIKVCFCNTHKNLHLNLGIFNKEYLFFQKLLNPLMLQHRDDGEHTWVLSTYM